MAMIEWGYDHVYINANWTDEQFNALLCRRIEVKQREAERMQEAHGEAPQKKVDNAAFFAQTGLKPEVIVRGDKSR